MSNERKIGVVLSGGGANGAYEAGLLKALFTGKSPATGKKPVEADIFTGTSVGSFNAGVLVSKTANSKMDCAQAARELEDLWLEKLAENPEGCDNGAFRIRADFIDYLNPKCFLKDPTKPFRELSEDSIFFARETAKRSMNFIKSKDPLAQRTIELLDVASALCTTPLHHLVDEEIDIPAILSPGAKDLFVVATNWDKGKALAFQNKNTIKPSKVYDVELLTEKIGTKSILASTAIPGVFPPVTIELGGKSIHFVDGGVLMNTPLSPAIRAGADEIHIVYFDPKLESLPEDYLPNTLGTTNRFLFVALAGLVNKDIEDAIKVNDQVSVAKKIKPIVDQLKKDHAAELKQKSSEIAQAVTRADEFITELAEQKHITVHKHYPSKILGGVLGLLNFKKKRMTDLVELGYRDAIEHDCAVNGCAVPGK